MPFAKTPAFFGFEPIASVMNGERTSTYPAGNGNTTYVTPPDSPGYFYNAGQAMAQNRAMQDQQTQQQASQQQQQEQHLQQQMPQIQSNALYRYTNPSSTMTNPALARAISTLSADKTRRPRSEKKPIPDEQKDDKYFERRRRNNEAAKKSRDARKAREDELAIRASYLEKDNSVLKVQVLSMREEAIKLRQMWFQKCQTGTAGPVNRHSMTPQARTS